MKLLKKLLYKSYTTKLTVTSDNGFHLRPIAQFVALSKTFNSDITANYYDKTVNAKAVNALLSLPLEQSDSFTLIAHGKDAQKATEALEALFNELMSKDESQTTQQKEKRNYEGEIVEGEVICEGIAIAPLYHLQSKEVYGEKHVTFEQAMQNVLDELERLSQNSAEQSQSHIFQAQHALLLSLNEECSNLETLQEHIYIESRVLEGGKHQAKIADYQDLLRRVKSHLGIKIVHPYPKENFILIADELFPSELETLQQTNVQGVILKSATANSHIAILLRAQKIPTLIADALHLESQEAILDTHAGILVHAPSADDMVQALKRQQQDIDAQNSAYRNRLEPALTSQKKQIKVYANVTDASSAKIAKEEGAEGIGLLRTEFLFTEQKPSFEVQKEAYEAIFDLFGDVTVRTLDVGGDKALPYIDITPEENPFLGLRGIRLFRTHPHILAEQLRAIFAAAEGKPIKIMFPMVSTVNEFTAAKALAQAIAKKHTLDITAVEFGIMVEVPSVLFQLEKFNEVVDFYSIGTNDLIQYLFAVERTHPTLKTDPLSPVVFDAIRTIIDKSTKPVSICGELAGDKRAIPTLIELGIETLSVSGKNVPQTKEVIRNV